MSWLTCCSSRIPRNSSFSRPGAHALDAAVEAELSGPSRRWDTRCMRRWGMTRLPISSSRTPNACSCLCSGPVL